MRRCLLLATFLAPLLMQGSPPEAERTLQAGLQLIQDGRLEEAVLVLDDVALRLKADPVAERGHLVLALVHKGVALVGLAQEELAKAAFREALHLDPSLRLSKDEFSARVLRVFDAAREGKAKSVLLPASGAPRKAGIGALGAAGIVAGVVAVGGGVAAVVGGDGGGVSTTTTTTTTTTTIVPVNRPPTLDFRTFPDPATGRVPLEVTVDLCGSSDPDGDLLQFRIEWGDGSVDGRCGGDHVYFEVGTYRLRGCATDKRSPEVCQSTQVKVEEKPRPSPSPSPPPYPLGAFQRLTWVSHLDVPGAKGQVVVGGTQVIYPASGLSHGIFEIPESTTSAVTVLVEAQLVEAVGRPGTWRFEFDSAARVGLFVPGSIRVVAGQVAMSTPSAVSFRFQGKPSERIVFSFEIP